MPTRKFINTHSNLINGFSSLYAPKGPEQKVHTPEQIEAYLSIRKRIQVEAQEAQEAQVTHVHNTQLTQDDNLQSTHDYYCSLNLSA